MKLFLTCLFSLLLCHTALQAEFVHREGSWKYVTENATLSAEGHYQEALDAYTSENYVEVVRQLEILTDNFSCGKFPGDAYFFLGVSYFQMGEYESANTALNLYLKLDTNPAYLTEAVAFKFAAAEAFRCGERARLFGYSQCPKWMNGRDLAVTIYDEVIATLPSSDLAARALFSKGSLLCEMQDFRCSIESFSTLIRRFPKHELTPDSYLAIDQVYLCQAQLEFQNPDVLVLAQLNLTRFRSDFPNDDRVQEASELVHQIQESYAWGLYSTGGFFERVCKPQAAVLYYTSAISQFPDTNIAQRCRERLCCLTGQDAQTCTPEDVL